MIGEHSERDVLRRRQGRGRVRLRRPSMLIEILLWLTVLQWFAYGLAVGRALAHGHWSSLWPLLILSMPQDIFITVVICWVYWHQVHDID